MGRHRKIVKHHHKPVELNELSEEQLAELNAKRIARAVKAASKLSKTRKLLRAAPGEIEHDHPCTVTLKKADNGKLMLRLLDGLSQKELAYVQIPHNVLVDMITGRPTACDFRMFNLGFLGLRKQMKRLMFEGLGRMKLGPFKRWYKEFVLPEEVEGWRVMRQSKIDAATALLKRHVKTERPNVKIDVHLTLVRWVPEDYTDGEPIEEPRKVKKHKDENTLAAVAATVLDPSTEVVADGTKMEEMSDTAKALIGQGDLPVPAEAAPEQPTVGKEIKEQMVEQLAKLRQRKATKKSPPKKVAKKPVKKVASQKGRRGKSSR